MTHIIYCIIDPADHRPFYIGRSASLDKRKRQHGAVGHGASGQHIDKIRDSGNIPFFVLLEECRTPAAARRAETFWIEIFKSRGVALLNKEITPGKHPPTAHRAWTKDDDALLARLHRAKTPPRDICAIMQRTRASITSRVRLLRL